MFRLIAEDLSNAGIADQLAASATTVTSHVNHLFAKIGVRNRAQASPTPTATG